MKTRFNSDQHTVCHSFTIRKNCENENFQGSAHSWSNIESEVELEQTIICATKQHTIV